MFKNMNGTDYIKGIHYDLIKFSSGKRSKVAYEDKLEMGGRTDLHIHSVASDGTLNIDEIVKLAILSNVKTLAITDHDSLIGTKELVRRNDLGLEIFSGIELSALVRSGKSRIHILGYDFDINSEKINKAVEFVDKCSEYNFKLYVRCIEDKFPEISIPKEEIEKVLEKRRNTGKNIGRVDIAHILIKLGYADKHKDEFPQSYTKQDIIFEKYLNPVKYQVQDEKAGITDQECIRAIKDAGGLVSLAHPSSLKLSESDLEDKIKLYKEWGLDALEVYHPNNTERQRRFYHHLAKRYNLLESGGTDYHGYEVKPDILLGHGRNGNIDIRENDISLVKELRKRR